MTERGLEAPEVRWLAAEPIGLSDRRLWIAATAILLLSLVERLYFYTGFYGSDEVTYLAAAVRALNGDFSPSTYIGSIRYGFQLPIAGFMFVFGQSEAVANLWTLICSMAEIALVILIGNLVVGFRAAVLGGLLLGTLPLHVHYAGRMMADPPLAFFMTATFLMFWLGQQRGTYYYFLAAGLAAGMVLWVKESTVIFLALFLTYPFVFRRWSWRWGWMILGFGLMFGANLLFFSQFADDPFYAFRIAGGTVSAYAGDDSRFAGVMDSPLFYLQYLFAKPYHTWLIGYLAATGVLIWMGAKLRGEVRATFAAYVVWWGFGMTILFSILPVSLEPLKLITKQVNYMLMFVAPLALLGGLALAKLDNRSLSLVAGLLVLPAAVLSAMEKNVVEVFTAGSKSAVQFAKAHPGAVVLGSTGARRAASFDALTHPEGLRVSIEPLTEAGNAPFRGPTVYAIVDEATVGWGSKVEGVSDLPAGCWKSYEELDPSVNLALPGVFSMGMAMANTIPSPLARGLSSRIEALTKPKVAQSYIYQRYGCGV